MPPTEPRFPIYIPSKGRSDNAMTPHELDRLGVDYRLVVEPQEHEQYAAVFGADRLLTLDARYQREYDTCDPEGDRAHKSVGAGAARNFAWDHAIAAGHEWHWVMDDNIRLFGRLDKNLRAAVGDGMIFHAMEEFVLRYTNIAMAGPEYWFFVTSRDTRKPFTLNRRVFSCSLIRNDVPLRWHGRYNEDLLLSIAMLKAGWCTVVFRAFLQDKITTQKMHGGNTDELCRDGTYDKTRLAVRMHPDIVRHVRRYGRDHHHVDFSEWKNRRLIRRDDYTPIVDNPYRTKLIDRPLVPHSQRAPTA